MNRSTRNRIFRSLLIKAGFSIEAPEDGSMAAHVRKATHRQLCGYLLADYRDRIQIGPNEPEARIYNFSAIPEVSRSYALRGNDPVWLLGPGAAYAARGYGFHLGQLVHLAEEYRAAHQPKPSAP